MNNTFNIKKTPRAEMMPPRTIAAFLRVLCGGFLGDLCGLRFAPDLMSISHRGVPSGFDLYVG
jgi:hypothetical protein